MAASDAEAAPENSHFTVPQQSPATNQLQSMSDSNALCKTLIVLILVLLVPLFPSQAPDFVTQNVFTDFWEIIQLLFIGIAVSYGLFGRRTAQIAPDRLVDSRTDDLSGISHLTSIFDDGYDNVSYEHDTMHSYVNFDGGLVGKDGYVISSGTKIRSLVHDDGIGSVSEGNGDRAWYSRHSKGESLVVVSNGKCFSGGNSDFKPLNLPVRSLRSSVLDNDKNEFKNRDGFSPKVEANGDDGFNVVKVRGMVPVNLEKKFEEVAERSTIPWRSRSGRMENGVEKNDSKLFAHSRPHSVGDFEFELEHLERSIQDSIRDGDGDGKRNCGMLANEQNQRQGGRPRDPGSVAVPQSATPDGEASRDLGHCDLKSRSIQGSRFSGSPELKSSNVEMLERKRVFTASHLKVAPIDSEASTSLSKDVSASSGMDNIGNIENKQKSSVVEEEASKGKQAIESLESDGTKSSSFAKAFPRAKSVRTIKPKRYTMNLKEHSSSRGDGKSGRVFIKSEADILIKRREEEPESPLADHENQESADICSMPKPEPTLPEFQNEERRDFVDRNTTNLEDEVIEFDKSSDEGDTRTQMDNDSELGSEVDRKADEFIAKFREQIRLQKTSSVKGFNGW